MQFQKLAKWVVPLLMSFFILVQSAPAREMDNSMLSKAHPYSTIDEAIIKSGGTLGAANQDLKLTHLLDSLFTVIFFGNMGWSIIGRPYFPNY